MIEIQRENDRFTITFLKNDLSDNLLQELLRRLESARFLTDKYSPSETQSEQIKSYSQKYYQTTQRILEIANKSIASSNGKRWTRDELYERQILC